ncbi:MAG: FKBP-type peptidyl-prolyl cis-trans isomerase [Acidobacteria bacterium]|nr:FKBP-type peptidyl-prolyl cis-trans isomerase [Acidobacteriota bacterium]
MRHHRFALSFALLICLLTLTACASSTEVATTKPSPTPEATAIPATTPAASPTPGEMKTTPSGLQYQDLQIGIGPRPLLGQNVQVAYVGKFLDGHKFDGGTIPFTIGETGIIKGWNLGVGGSSKEGIDAMRVGGKRKIIVPPQLGYGDRIVSTIPPNSTLVFELELIRINSKSF